MTQLALFQSQRLHRPVGVDWFRRLERAKLLNLKPGNFVWFKDGGFIECAQVTGESKRFDELGRHGIQVFCSNRTRICCPRLILDKKPSPFFMIIDREAAYEYYERAQETVVEETKLRLVGTG